MKKLILLTLIATSLSCKNSASDAEKEMKETSKEKTTASLETPFVWEAANLYFLMTDRFNNADPSNDVNFGRDKKTAKLRGFEGGDIKGVTQKIEDGYFSDLGINAIWLTPVVEQIHGGTDEGTGTTYAFHGYWTKDWTALDPNFGTKADLKALVDSAHKKGIRIVLDAVVNHTGPVTAKDPVWPDAWVRTGPTCTYEDYESTVACTLVDNLPDIRTESDEAVELPPQLVRKWKDEGRYDEEVAELDAFFQETGHPRAPRFYIMKWLADYITDFGIDGYRVDTVKHTEESVWQEFRSISDAAFAEFKANNPEKVLDDNGFYMVGEVYNYGISAEKAFDFGDKKVNYFDKAFNSIINFELKYDAAKQTKEAIFKRYSKVLNGDMQGYGVLNYLSSHDDGSPFDAKRENPYETATILMLTPGAAQVFYGDESARILEVEGTEGDAKLRSNMNWEAIKNDAKTQKILAHWQKLGTFRSEHPAIGAGVHQMITQKPYVFYRSFTKGDFKDLVVVGLDLKAGSKTLKVSSVFEDGTILHDAYSKQDVTVEDGSVTIVSDFGIVLLELKK